jgi:hypothetical protein
MIKKSAHTSFPHEGVELHVTLQDALAHGIGPGDPAVIEATVRPYTVQEWLMEGAGRTFATEAEKVDFYSRCPVPATSMLPVSIEHVAEASPPQPAQASARRAQVEAADAAPVAGGTTPIRWRSRG